MAIERLRERFGERHQDVLAARVAYKAKTAKLEGYRREFQAIAEQLRPPWWPSAAPAPAPDPVEPEFNGSELGQA
eukprot:11200276-Lingulodinium_polyedra.AAC.1